MFHFGIIHLFHGQANYLPELLQRVQIAADQDGPVHSWAACGRPDRMGTAKDVGLIQGLDRAEKVRPRTFNSGPSILRLVIFLLGFLGLGALLRRGV